MEETLVPNLNDYEAFRFMWDSIPEPAVPTIAILNEHVAFLREQLSAKRYWYEDALQAEKTRANNLTVAVEKYRQECEKLKIALMQACGEVLSHNEQEDNPHTTNSSVIDYWMSLLKVNDFRE